MPYCRNCGKELAAEAVFCPVCGVPPPKGNKYCQNCGSQVDSLAEVCVKCGARLTRISVNKKSKVNSVLLAVFLGPVTWLYTYKRDKTKFWIGFGATTILGIVSLVPLVSLITSAMAGALDLMDMADAISGAMGIYGLLSLAGTALWLWSIVDTAVKKQEWYDNY